MFVEFSLISVTIVTVALLLDLILGEVRRCHPLVIFGNWAIKVERYLNNTRFYKTTVAQNTDKERSEKRAETATHFGLLGRLSGLLAWVVAVLPVCAVALWLEQFLLSSFDSQSFWYFMFASIVLYFCLGWQSLLGHAKAIIQPLKASDMSAARYATSMIVSRETAQLDENQISVAATESVLENGADAIFSAIFWFLLLGVPGVVLYRLANTLDAMWGYKNQQYYYFGWAAARIDDLLNFIPARLTALSYVLLGNSARAWQCWRSQGINWKSPNAGPVMASGAGALNVRLGGGNVYHGVYQERPILGLKDSPSADRYAIQGACYLVDRVLLLWLIVLIGIAFVI